jgi:hypothetical protein
VISLKNEMFHKAELSDEGLVDDDQPVTDLELRRFPTASESKRFALSLSQRGSRHATLFANVELLLDLREAVNEALRAEGVE